MLMSFARDWYKMGNMKEIKTLICVWNERTWRPANLQGTFLENVCDFIRILLIFVYFITSKEIRCYLNWYTDVMIILCNRWSRLVYVYNFLSVFIKLWWFLYGPEILSPSWWEELLYKGIWEQNAVENILTDGATEVWR